VAQRTCSIDGCGDTRIAAAGLCWRHYQRRRRTGSTALREVERVRVLAERWFAERDRSTGCWDDWPHAVAAQDRRPRATWNGRGEYISRMYLLWMNGSPPVFACHKCDNPPCINPDHIYAGTPQLNVDDRDRRRRLAADAATLPDRLDGLTG
jgi:hypothetical protein